MRKVGAMGVMVKVLVGFVCHISIPQSMLNKLLMLREVSNHFNDLLAGLLMDQSILCMPLKYCIAVSFS